MAVCAVRTGCGKSQTSRRVAHLLRAAGLDVVLVRHPMPYGDLEAMRVQRFATLADIDAADPTIEEREESRRRCGRGSCPSPASTTARSSGSPKPKPT